MEAAPREEGLANAPPKRQVGTSVSGGRRLVKSRPFWELALERRANPAQACSANANSAVPPPSIMATSSAMPSDCLPGEEYREAGDGPRRTVLVSCSDLVFQ